MRRALYLILFGSLLLPVGCNEQYNDPAPRDEDTGAADSGVDSGDAMDADDVEDTQPPAPGVFDYSPAQLTFEGVMQGEPASKSVLLKNLGESELLVTDLRLVEEADGGDDGELQPGERWIGESLTIPADVAKKVDVTLAPSDFAVDRGYLEITVLAEEQSRHIVPIESINAYPDIDAPRTVRLGQVEPGEDVSRQVTIYNRGMEVLTVDSLALSGSNAISYEFRAGSEVPSALQRGDFVTMDVTFAPENEAQHTSLLTVTSSDPDEPSFNITILGNEPSPCLRVSSRTVDFDAIPVDEQARQPLQLFNCSQDRTLEISGISFSTSANGIFSVEIPDALPIDLLPTQTTSIDVLAESSQEGPAVGVLTIRSSDEEQSPMLVDVRADFESR